MSYRLVELELTRPLAPVVLDAGETGCGIIARWQDQLIGFVLLPITGGVLSTAMLAQLADQKFASAILIAKAEREVADRSPQPERLPRLSIAICTKDRAERLSRLLAALSAVRPASVFSDLEIIVVDNASVDASTRDAVAAFPNVRYVFEARAGLDFARNSAVHSATGDLLAFLDDDVVVDRHWLDGLAAAWRSNPAAGGFTGLVLPYKLDTEARLLFEQRGGFGRGFSRREFHATSFALPLHPVGAGVLGAGCNMAFERSLLIELGGFDEALDTGAPLPGGGDLDIFYRVLRAGRAMVYEPRYAVYHEHRETIAQLRRQYWTWGLGMMAFLDKCRRADPQLRDQHRRMIRWWTLDQLKLIVRALRRHTFPELRFHLAELWGGICGVFGEYDRSRGRVAAIRAER